MGVAAMPEPRASAVGRVGLCVLSWGLAFHVVVMAILFGGLGWSAGAVRTVAAWKEVAVVTLVLLVIVRAATGHGPRTRLVPTDMWVGGLIALAVIFLVGGRSLFGFDVTGKAAVYGFRDVAFFLLLYFVGRSTPEIISDPRTLKRLYIVALVVSIIGIVEWVFVAPEQLVLLGVASYFQDFLGLSAFTTGNEYGLPHSYWTRIGGTDVQRVGSVFLGGQGMAVPFLILIPAATGWLVARARRGATSGSAWAWGGYAVIWLGFLLTITRVTMLAVTASVAVFLLLLRRPMGVLSIGAIGIAGFIVGVVALPGLATWTWETFTWQSGSSRTHLQDWGTALTALAERPLGSGLGTTGISALRAGERPLAIDNQYLEYAVSLGFAGLLLLLLAFAAILLSCARVIRAGSDPDERLFATVVLSATVGIMLNGVTAGVFYSLLLAYLYAWFAGAATTVASRVESLPRPAGRMSPSTE